jgi:hypothetical protein
MTDNRAEGCTRHYYRYDRALRVWVCVICGHVK